MHVLASEAFGKYSHRLRNGANLVVMKPIQPLLQARYLYDRGDDVLSEKGPFSAGFAVSLFQDAVESLLGTIVKEVGASVPGYIRFEAYWDLVKKGPKAKGRELPPNAKMLQLNSARIGFKHHGNVPALDTAASLQLYAHSFLTEACETFFKCKFDALSMVDLIESEEFRKHLYIAEEAIENDNAKTALERCAFVYRHLTETIDALWPPIENAFHWGELLTDLNTAIKISDAEARLRQIEETLTTTRIFALTTSLRIPLEDYLRFKKIIPSVTRMNGELCVWWIDEKQVHTLDNAEFAVRYLARFAVALERTLAGVTKPSTHLPIPSPIR